MARLCTVKAHHLAPILAKTDQEITQHLKAAAAQDPLRALHLCHELLAAQQTYLSRPGLQKRVGREVELIGKQLTNQPEITQ